MQTLKFIIDGQSIKQDPSCDFSGLFPGTKEVVRAEFVFSSEWNNAVKVAAFWSMMGNEYPPQLLDDDSCLIPTEALMRPVFKIQVLGKRGQTSLKTNNIRIYQKGGKK